MAAPEPERLVAALDYAAHGWRVLPLKPDGKEPLGRLVRHGLRDASNDPGQIRAWWTAEPDANVGVVCDSSSFDVLDVDGAEGARTLTALETLHGPLPETREHSTPRGRHVFFRPSGLPCTTGRLGQGLDTKGGGRGYVVMPPSVVNGKRYTITKDSELAAVPDAIVDGASGALASAPVGARNSTANREAFVAGLNIDPATAPEAERALVAACPTSPTFPEAEARRAVRRGLTAGLRIVARRYRNVPYAPEDDPRFRSLSADAAHVWFRLLTWRASIIVPGVSVGADEASLARTARLPETRVRAALRELRRRGLLRADRPRRLFWLTETHVSLSPINESVAKSWLKAIYREIPPCPLRAALLESLRRSSFRHVWDMRVTLDARGRMQALPPLQTRLWNRNRSPLLAAPDPPAPTGTAAKVGVPPP